MTHTEKKLTKALVSKVSDTGTRTRTHTHTHKTKNDKRSNVEDD